MKCYISGTSIDVTGSICWLVSSITGIHLSLALVLAMSAGRYRKSEAKAVIKETDMLEELQQQAANCAYEALQHHQQYMDIARYVRKRFDDLYGPSWSCVVGADFGA